MAKTFVSLRAVSVMGAVGLCALGCQLWRGQRIETPVPYTEQSAAIKKIVPEGTARDEAVHRLNEAGIEGEFSRAGKSIYYCNIWNRKKSGKRAHLNIALLFDREGRFYATRPSDSDAGTYAGSGPSTTSSDLRSAGGNRVAGRLRGESVFPAARAENSSAAQSPARTLRRGDEHRTPFYDPDGP